MEYKEKYKKKKIVINQLMIIKIIHKNHILTILKMRNLYVKSKNYKQKQKKKKIISLIKRI